MFEPCDLLKTYPVKSLHVFRKNRSILHKQDLKLSVLYKNHLRKREMPHGVYHKMDERSATVTIQGSLEDGDGWGAHPLGPCPTLALCLLIKWVHKCRSLTHKSARAYLRGASRAATPRNVQQCNQVSSFSSALLFKKDREIDVLRTVFEI